MDAERRIRSVLSPVNRPRNPGDHQFIGRRNRFFPLKRLHLQPELSERPVGRDGKVDVAFAVLVREGDRGQLPDSAVEIGEGAAKFGSRRDLSGGVVADPGGLFREQDPGGGSLPRRRGQRHFAVTGRPVSFFRGGSGAEGVDPDGAGPDNLERERPGVGGGAEGKLHPFPVGGGFQLQPAQRLALKLYFGGVAAVAPVTEGNGIFHRGVGDVEGFAVEAEPPAGPRFQFERGASGGAGHARVGGDASVAGVAVELPAALQAAGQPGVPEVVGDTGVRTPDPRGSGLKFLELQVRDFNDPRVEEIQNQPDRFGDRLRHLEFQGLRGPLPGGGEFPRRQRGVRFRKEPETDLDRTLGEVAHQRGQPVAASGFDAGDRCTELRFAGENAEAQKTLRPEVVQFGGRLRLLKVAEVLEPRLRQRSGKLSEPFAGQIAAALGSPFEEAGFEPDRIRNRPRKLLQGDRFEVDLSLAAEDQEDRRRFIAGLPVLEDGGTGLPLRRRRQLQRMVGLVGCRHHPDHGGHFAVGAVAHGRGQPVAATGDQFRQLDPELGRFVVRDDTLHPEAQKSLAVFRHRFGRGGGAVPAGEVFRASGGEGALEETEVFRTPVVFHRGAGPPEIAVGDRRAPAGPEEQCAEKKSGEAEPGHENSSQFWLQSILLYRYTIESGGKHARREMFFFVFSALSRDRSRAIRSCDRPVRRAVSARTRWIWAA